MVEGLARALIYSYVLGLILMILGIPFFLVGYCASVNCTLPDSVYNFFILVYGVGMTWLPIAGIQGIIPWFYAAGFLPSSAEWQLVGIVILVPAILVQYLFIRRLFRAMKTDEAGPLRLAAYHHLAFAAISAVYMYYTVGPLVSIIAIFLNLAGFQGFRNAASGIKEKERLNRPRPVIAGAPPN